MTIWKTTSDLRLDWYCTHRNKYVCSIADMFCWLTQKLNFRFHFFISDKGLELTGYSDYDVTNADMWSKAFFEALLQYNMPNKLYISHINIVLVFHKDKDCSLSKINFGNKIAFLKLCVVHRWIYDKHNLFTAIIFW